MLPKENNVQISEGSPERDVAFDRVGNERVVEGIGVAPGIAIGPVYLYARAAFEVEERHISRKERDAEIKRFEDAVSNSERDLKKIASVAREKLGEGSASIFDAQALMLRDEAFFDAVIERIRNDRMSADYGVQTVINKHRQLLKASESEYLRERANDMLDLQDRIVRHLRRGKILSDVDSKTIVVAESLTAADIVLFSRRGILGTVLDYGGATSHVSIMARALSLPAVVSTHGVTSEVATGDTMILDGLDGRVIINPTEETLQFYRDRKERYHRLQEEQKQLVPLPAETLDGHGIRLTANLEFQEELKLIEEYGAKGVGLFRTEILFLMQRRISLSEAEQFDTYRRIVQSVGPDTTTFRVLDFGGDKMLPMGHREHNPFLGWRGIRILLDKPELLYPQVRAIVRASAYGPVRILLPMVTEIGELRAFKQILREVYGDLEADGETVDPEIPVGIMVEVPAVAIKAARFAREADFFSIGTNDLTQYTLAVDRGNDLVASKYQELDPAILQLIKSTVDAARAEGIPVSVCGELAARPLATPILLGLGVDELSASPVYLPEIKRVIRAIRMEEAVDLARRSLDAGDAHEVTAILRVWLKEHACDVATMLEGDGRDVPGSA
ncbi:MAG: phosphoenolpyruvate--protein phosphotransferase [Rhodothermales bacterium]